MQPTYTIKPEYTPFVLIQAATATTVLVLVAVILSLLLRFAEVPYWWVVLPAVAILLLVIIANRHAQFHKTKTEFYKKRIIHYTGGLVSNRQTTLEIHNVTHIKLIHPFLRHALFSTSHLRVQAAGSGGVEVHAQDFLHGEETYTYLQQLMQKNGFSIKKTRLLQQEKPSTAAILIQNIGFAALFLFFLGPGTIGAIFFLGALAPLAILLFVAIIPWFVTYLLDQIKREYHVYEDAIEYHEGFLTKKHSLLPAENLAEANNTQQLLDRILGVSNIVISTQGSGQTSFSNMPRGEQLEKTIDELAKAYKPLTNKTATQKPTQQQAATKQASTQTNKEIRANTFSSAYKQHLPRALLTAVLTGLGAAIVATAFIVVDQGIQEATGVFAAVIFLVVFMLGAGRTVTQALFTDYEVRERGVYQKYELLQRTTQEFTDDKLVGLEIKRNVADKLLNTASITFQSLSTAPNVTFKHIKNPQQLIQALKKKYYLDTAAQQTIPAQYSLARAASKNASLLLAVTIFSIGAYTAATLLTPIPQNILNTALAIIAASTFLAGVLRILTYKNSSLLLAEEHLEHTVGFLTTKTEVVRYEDIKHQAGTHYRATSVGSVYVGIGGTSQAADQSNQRSLSVPNGFSANYLPKSHEVLDTLDARILNEKNTLNQALKTTRQELKNRFYNAALLSIPTLLLSLVWLPISMWRASKYRYEQEAKRVVEYRGVWHTTKHSVLYKNIDHLASNEGLINKLAKNGNVHIYTLGSSGAELTLRNINDYHSWREELEKNYQ